MRGRRLEGRQLAPPGRPQSHLVQASQQDIHAARAQFVPIHFPDKFTVDILPRLKAGDSYRVQARHESFA